MQATTAHNVDVSSGDFVGRDHITIGTDTIAELAHEVGKLHQLTQDTNERVKRLECAVIGNGRPGLMQAAVINRYLSVTALIAALAAFLVRS